MKKDKFVTQSLRDATGQCQTVHDVVMINLGIERLGTCSACGHDITHHYGIYGDNIGYMWVGSCCKKILCASDKLQINPNHGIISKDKFDRDIIFLDESVFLKLHKIGHGRDYEHGYVDCLILDQFVCNICSTLKTNFEFTQSWFLTVKQYDCVKKYL
jgi:hypothetical protein